MRTNWLVMVCVFGAACTSGGADGPNQAPTAPEVSVSPLEPLSTDALVAHLVAESTDPDGDEITYSYAWIRDGVPQTSLTTDTVDAAETSRDEVWEVRVIASDGELTSAAGSATVSVRNAVPAVSATWARPTATAQDDLAVVIEATDGDADPLAVTYAWTLDGVPFAEATDTVSALVLAPGQIWHVVVTADDGHDGVSTAALDATILNSAPTVTDVVLSPSPAGDGDSLTATASVVDPDGDPVTLSWSFFQNGALFRTGADPVLTPSATVVGDTWTAEVIATDGATPTGPFRSNGVVIADLPPTQPLVVIRPEAPQPCDNLVCVDAVPSVDPDGPGVLSTLVWTRNGAVWDEPRARADVVPAWAVEPGDVWSCSYTGTSNGLTGNAGVDTVTVGDGHAVETFPVTGPGPTELLIAIDDRSSAAAVQPLLAAAMPTLLDELNLANVDYRVGVLAASSGGRLVRTAAGVPYVDRQTPDAALTLSAMVQVGNRGSSQDVLGATLKALTGPVATTDNAAFFRPGERLAILWVIPSLSISYWNDDNFSAPLERRFGRSNIDVRLLTYGAPSGFCYFSTPDSFTKILRHLSGDGSDATSACSGPLHNVMTHFSNDAAVLPWTFALGRYTELVTLAMIDPQGSYVAGSIGHSLQVGPWKVILHENAVPAGFTLEVGYTYQCTGSREDQHPPGWIPTGDTGPGADTSAHTGL